MTSNYHECKLKVELPQSHSYPNFWAYFQTNSSWMDLATVNRRKFSSNYHYQNYTHTSPPTPTPLRQLLLIDYRSSFTYIPIFLSALQWNLHCINCEGSDTSTLTRLRYYLVKQNISLYDEVTSNLLICSHT